MDVVGVPVVRGAYGDDAAQLGRLEGRDLEPVETAPGLADDRHLTVGPVLLLDPVEDFEGVGELGGVVLVEHDAAGVSAAAAVDAYGRVSGCRELGVERHVAGSGAVVLAVRDVLQNGRYRSLCVRGQPHPGSEPGAVVEWNPHVALDAYGVSCGDVRGTGGAHGPGR